MHQIRFWLGFRHRPHWRVSSDLLAGFKGAPQNVALMINIIIRTHILKNISHVPGYLACKKSASVIPRASALET